MNYAALGPKEALGSNVSAMSDIRSHVRICAMRVIGSINEQLKGKGGLLDAIQTVDGDYGDKLAVSTQRTVTVDLNENMPQEIYYELIVAYLDAGWSAVRLVVPGPNSSSNILHVLLFMTIPGHTPPESGIVDSTGHGGSIRGFQHLPKIPQENNGDIENSGIYSGDNKPIDVLSLR